MSRYDCVDFCIVLCCSWWFTHHFPFMHRVRWSDHFSLLSSAGWLVHWAMTLGTLQYRTSHLSMIFVFGPCPFCAIPFCGSINTPMLITRIPMNSIVIQICITLLCYSKFIEDFNIAMCTSGNDMPSSSCLPIHLLCLEHVCGYPLVCCKRVRCMD